MSEIGAQYGLVAGSILMGSAFALATWTLVHVVTFPKARFSASNEFENERLATLRKASGTFRWFEPIVNELSGLSGPENDRQREFERNLKLAGELPWKAKEFQLTKSIESVLCAVAIFCFIAVTGFWGMASIMAILLLVSFRWMAESSVVKKASRRMNRIRLRMPFAVDQIALMMQAGADFDASLQTVVRDNKEHPLSHELAEVLRQVTLGRPRSQALNDLRARLDDKDIAELVFAINKGEELGTPLSSILREQADQMRMKRSQWGEKAASEAEVQMVFPGMIVMVACLLVIVAPILLPTLMSFLDS